MQLIELIKINVNNRSASFYGDMKVHLVHTMNGEPVPDGCQYSDQANQLGL